MCQVEVVLGRKSIQDHIRIEPEDFGLKGPTKYSRVGIYDSRVAGCLSLDNKPSSPFLTVQRNCPTTNPDRPRANTDSLSKALGVCQ